MIAVIDILNGDLLVELDDNMSYYEICDYMENKYPYLSEDNWYIE